MIKPCVVLNGEVINVGKWDYQIQMVEIEPAEYDEEGNVIKEVVLEEVIGNPLPEGAMIEERDFEYDEDRGWYEVGAPEPPTEKERLESLEQAIIMLMMEG